MVWSNGKLLHGGKYRIERILGRGGFGITYKARHTQLNQDVVIKTPDETLQIEPDYPKYVQRFIQEGQVLAQLCREPHPHIVRVIDLFQEGDIHCLVMDFIEGESLYERVQRRGRIPEAEAVKYICEIGSALTEVHKANLVHRDVHPGNIMLRSSGRAVLIDFGISGEMFPTTMTSRHFGNKAFAPYEQQRKGSRHPRVDIYTLAASLYYALTGELPTNSFDRKYDKLELMPPKRLVPRISDEVNRAILKGMELEPEKRPQSMQEWLKLLEPKQVAAVSTPQPVQPSPQRSGLRNGSSIPRHRLNTKSTWAVGAVVALTLVALAGALVGRQYPFLSSKPQVSPTERNLPTNPNSAATNPTSAVRVDYSKLQNLLAQDKWKEADQETQNVMQKVAGREKDRWLRDEDLEKFPCTDLRTIDTLWVKYSKGRFGFSVQKRIWKSVGGTPDADETYLRLTYLRLSDRIKWHVNNDWLDYNSLTFSVEKAPEGHLPGWGGGKSGWWGSLFSRLETCRV
jgi:serine/threonine-protein kinase